MKFMSLFIMIAVLGWNLYGVFEVGVENASMMQWGVSGLMFVFVFMQLVRLFKE